MALLNWSSEPIISSPVIRRTGSVLAGSSRVASMATDSPIGPDLGPSPAEDGVPAFDETYKWVGPGGLQVTFGIVYERDPERGKRLNERQNAVILELLQWWRDAQKQIAAGTRCPGQAATPRTASGASSLPSTAAVPAAPRTQLNARARHSIRTLPSETGSVVPVPERLVFLLAGHWVGRDHALARPWPLVMITASSVSARLACSTGRSTVSNATFY